MEKKKSRRKQLSVLLIISIFLLNTCNYGPGLFPPKEYVYTDPEITIAWDPPDDEKSVTGYRVYYRLFESDDWVYIQQVDDPQTTEYTIKNGILPFGLIIFAITSMSEEGIESEKHTSLDKSAVPETGWYVNWKATE